MLRKFGIIAVLSLMALALAAVPVFAKPTATSGVHFTRGNTPTCTIVNDGTSAFTNCTSELTGVGEGDIVISANLSGSVVYQCQNQGGNIAPGQNKVLVGPTGSSTVVPSDQGINGRLSLPISTSGDPLTAEPEVDFATAGCQNPNWTGVNPTLAVTEVHYSATQGTSTLFDCTATGTNLTGTIRFTDAQCGGVARFR